LAKRRLRLSQARVRSTTQRRGSNSKAGGSGPLHGLDRPVAELGEGLVQGKHTIQIENRTGERGRFWFLQYPYGFEPHLVEYEPFLSGKRLLLSPSFRDLYKTQLVDEAESLTVSDTSLFTDLKDSTPLYDSVGDVNAYFLVRQHFDILDKVIRERSSTIVKTIGDASWPPSNVLRTPFALPSR
jgi:hypothetical protein